MIVSAMALGSMASAATLEVDDLFVLGTGTTGGGMVWHLSSTGAFKQASGNSYGNLKAAAFQPNGNLVIGNDAGHVWVLNGSDLTQELYHATGYGDIVDIEVRSDNGVVIANSNTVYSTGANLQGGMLRTNLGNAVSSIALLSDDRIVVGRTDNASHLLSPDTSVVEATQAGFGQIVDVDVQSNDRIVVSNAATLYLRESDLTTGVASSTSGYWPIVDIEVQSDDEVTVLTNNQGFLYSADKDTMNWYDFGGLFGGNPNTLALRSDDWSVTGRSDGFVQFWLANLDWQGTNLSGYGDVADIVVVPIPEPASLALLGLGVAALLPRRKRN
jgi:hypothetical protein